MNNLPALLENSSVPRLTQGQQKSDNKPSLMEDTRMSVSKIVNKNSDFKNNFSYDKREAKKWTALRAECELTIERVKSLDHILCRGSSKTDLVYALKREFINEEYISD